MQKINRKKKSFGGRSFHFASSVDDKRRGEVICLFTVRLSKSVYHVPCFAQAKIGICKTEGEISNLLYLNSLKGFWGVKLKSQNSFDWKGPLEVDLVKPALTAVNW